MHLGRRGTLDASDVFAVICQLEKKVRLGMPRELRVLDLVVPGPAPTGESLIDPTEKIRVSETDAIEEGSLVEDLVPALHSRFGIRRGACNALKLAPMVDAGNLPAFGKELPEVVLLMLVAKLREEFRLPRPLRRTDDVPYYGFEVEGRQVFTGKVVVQVSRRDDDLSIE
jgi:hypothetical protein